MNYAAEHDRIGAARGPGPLGLQVAPSLSETVGEFCKDMLRMRKELQRAHREIARLHRELAGASDVPKVPGSSMRAMRREISFYCHPDRGGDNELMQRVNFLFDYLECRPKPTVQDRSGGAAQ